MFERYIVPRVLCESIQMIFSLITRVHFSSLASIEGERERKLGTRHVSGYLRAKNWTLGNHQSLARV